MALSLEATCKLSEKCISRLLPFPSGFVVSILTAAYTKPKSNKIIVRGEFISSSMTAFKCLGVCVCFSDVTTK